MIHKIQHGIELIFILITINLQPIVGAVSGIILSVYYLSMLKINVVNKEYEGSWKKYIKSIFKI